MRFRSRGVHAMNMPSSEYRLRSPDGRTACGTRPRSRCTLRAAAVYLLSLTSVAGIPVRGQSGSGASPDPASPEFAPGVRIDWQHRRVELDAEIVLRKGALELFACSPHSREHESILRVRARPLHVFQAMGLIGLTPGAPARYESKGERWVRATGETVSLRVRYPSKGVDKVSPIEAWLLDVKHSRPPEKIDWMFAGSRTLDGGRFGADLDGTIVCVVDFDTALITVGDLHSADNELLWLEANTEAIPPVGTRCTLLIQAATEPAIQIDLSGDGLLTRDGKTVSVETVAKLALEVPQRDGKPAVILRVEAGVSVRVRQRAVDSLHRAGVPRASVEVRTVRSTAKRPAKPGP